MDNKVRLPHASLIATLGILLALISVYVPMLGIVSLAIPVPYAIIGTLADRKYYVLSLVVTFFILMFGVNPIYSVSICIMSVIPGIVIGSIVKHQMNEEYANKFEPIYMGTIIVVASMIVFFFIANVVFGTNILNEFTKAAKDIMAVQLDIITKSGLDLGEGLKADDLVDYIRNILPTILLLQGMIISFIIYYLEAFILRRVRRLNLQIPKFEEFYLPGNAIMVSFVFYLLVMLMDAMNVKLHTDLIMLNLQLVFNFMFMIQGISLGIYYFKKWMKEGTIKMIFMSVFILCIFGFTGIAFVGMLDSIMDFRKIRSYKST
ncbi:DUF2232 domain-containing protein [Romboutsia sp.]|uniref:DUF2232 domain-containing protein n=1 Tax=Romboutsia sp. TaxID=1965302 RepID=UPI003F334EC0